MAQNKIGNEERIEEDWWLLINLNCLTQEHYAGNIRWTTGVNDNTRWEITENESNKNTNYLSTHSVHKSPDANSIADWVGNIGDDKK